MISETERRDRRSQRKDLRVAPGRGHVHARGKKTAAAIHAEVAREVTTLLGRVFAERKQAGDLDLEAVEMAIRAALHIDIMLEQSGIVKLYKVYKSTNSANFCLAVSGSLVSILYRVL